MPADFPTDVAELHRRLGTAREEFRKQKAEIQRLTFRLGELQALYALYQNVVTEVLRILRGDGDTGLDHEACVEARELAGVAATTVTVQRRAGGRVDLIRRTLAFLTEARVQELVESIGHKQEVVRLLSLLRAELDDEGS